MPAEGNEGSRNLYLDNVIISIFYVALYFEKMCFIASKSPDKPPGKIY